MRIICLTEEFTEIIYLLGREVYIVGISGFTVRPLKARKEKPKVSTFIDANYELIELLRPDIIFAFSDIQAEIVKQLIQLGYNVLCFNQRSIEDILSLIITVGAIINERKKAEELVSDFRKKLEEISKSAPLYKPRVYFEEWYDPLISGIRWVEESIAICGGINIFPHLKEKKLAKDRIIFSEDVIEKDPEIIIGSWCGKQVKKDKIIARAGWNNISAVKNNRIYEIRSSIILQPGPALFLEGIDELKKIIHLFSR